VRKDIRSREAREGLMIRRLEWVTRDTSGKVREASGRKCPCQENETEIKGKEKKGLG